MFEILILILIITLLANRLNLHRYDDQVADKLCLGVRRLFLASGSYGIPGELRLWLNDLSGDRLFAAGATDLDEYPETLWFEDSQRSALARRIRTLWFTASAAGGLPLCQAPDGKILSAKSVLYRKWIRLNSPGT